MAKERRREKTALRGGFYDVKLGRDGASILEHVVKTSPSACTAEERYGEKGRERGETRDE